MYKIIFTKKFTKNFEKRISKKLKPKVDAIIRRLEKWPPFEKQYNVHQLQWGYYPYYSINLTGDIRIIFDIDRQNKKIYLLDIWTHSQLYR